jgi:mono/diheme cytochrome c family protein
MKPHGPAALTALFCLLTLGCSHSQVPLPKVPEVSEAGTSRGEYIVRSVAVCGGCHSSDPKHDADGPLSGGMEFHDWRIGTARASNLTPDPETGLGSWNDAEIVRALRNGQSRDGRLLTPVMPYEWFHEMSDDDAFAVARYLNSLPPVRNDVRQSPNLMFKLGKVFFLRPKPAISAAAPPRGATVQYGGYLAQHVGLCGECHTPRSRLLQRPVRSLLFAGMPHPPKSFPAQPPNLTPHPAAGIGKWSQADFVRAIRTGITPDGEKLNPFMPWPKLQRMTDDDLHAIYEYLHTLPPARTQ